MFLSSRRTRALGTMPRGREVKIMATKLKGFQPIAQRQIDESIKLVAKASAPLGPVRRMDPVTRRRIVRMRKGGAAVIPTLVDICKRNALAVPGVSFDDITSKVAHAERLTQLERTVALFLRDIKDELLLVQGDAWMGARAAYAILQGAAKAQPGIATELAKVHAVFSNRAPASAARAIASKTAPASPAPAATHGTTAASVTPA
jgi:hypothetical protein